MALNVVPNAGQSLAVTRDPIRNNFGTINAAFLVDHVEYNIANQGQHNKVTMPVQGGAPVFAAGSNGLYNLNNVTTTKNELYVHKQTQAGTADIPFTASAMSNLAFAACDDGWTYLPSGLLIKWGAQAANAAAVAVTPTVTSGGPNFQRVFRVMVTPFDSSGAVNFNCGQQTVAAAPSGNFTAYCSNFSGTTSIRYLVLGV